MQTILLIGRDVPLLQTRSALLQRLGRVVSLQPAELGTLPEEDFGLVILCHTLGAADRAAVIAETRRLGRAEILQLQSPLQNSPANDTDAAVTARPDLLIAKVQSMLDNQRAG